MKKTLLLLTFCLCFTILHGQSYWSLSGNSATSATFWAPPILRNYVQQNRHLPGVPSAAEVEENGVELGATTELLLQKIEEMTLYIFQLEERLQQLENKKGGVK